MQESRWAAILASVAACITAYSEFSDTDKKLLRYSDSINILDSILLWWRTLTNVEKASIRNIDELVDNCEGVFMSERQAWVSTMMTANQKKAKDGEEEEGEEK